MKNLSPVIPKLMMRRVGQVVAYIGVSSFFMVCKPSKTKMATQHDIPEQTTPSSDDSRKQGSGNGTRGRQVQPPHESQQVNQESPDSVREIPIGSPLSPAEWERLKREAQKPAPRPPKEENDSDGQQDDQPDE